MKAIIETPVGYLEITTTLNGVSSIQFKDNITEEYSPQNEITKEAAKQLAAYVKGESQTFKMPLDLSGTEFQKRVWHELQKIPYGTTISYLELARRLGDEKSIRAAASANGKNPIAIVVPCHRVIGSNGDLVGYAGGLNRKKWLLQHEGALDQLELFSS